MATELEINAKINTAGSAESLSAIKKSLKELVSLQGQVGAGSKEFAKLREAINQTEGKLGDLNDSFATLRGSGVERLNSSVGLLKEGFESFDSGKLKAGFQGLGSAMSAIPIFLLVEGIKLLAENAKELFDWFTETTDQGESLTSQLKNMKKENELLSASFQNQITALEGIKGNEEAIYKIKGQLIAQSKEEAKLALAIAITKENDAKNEYTWKQRLLQAVGASAVAELDKRKVVKEATEERVKAENVVGKVIADGIKQDNERTQKQIDANKKLSEDRKKLEEEDEKNRQARIARALAEDEADAQIKIARFEEEEANKVKAEADAMAEFDRITKEVQQQADKDYDQLKANNARILAEEKRVQSAKEATIIGGVQTISAIGNLLISDQKKVEKFNKITALTQIAIDTAKGVSAVVAAAAANPNNAWSFGGAGVAQVAIQLPILFANMLKARKILETGSTSAPSLGGSVGGGGSVGTGANLPAQQQQTLSNQSNLFQGVNPGQQNANGNVGQQNITKVVVLESDITKAVNKVSMIETQAKFG